MADAVISGRIATDDAAGTAARTARHFAHKVEVEMDGDVRRVHIPAGTFELERNLARFGLDGRVAILEGDAFELLPGGALGGRRVGVYYYDAGHTYEQQLDGLLLAEPYLADDALVIVDDTDWDFVDAAVRDYRAQRPNVTSLLRIEGKDKGQPWWWEGVEVMEWRAP